MKQDNKESTIKHPFTVLKDGQEVHHGERWECEQYILNDQPFSVQKAIWYYGYEIRENQ